MRGDPETGAVGALNWGAEPKWAGLKEMRQGQDTFLVSPGCPVTPTPSTLLTRDQSLSSVTSFLSPHGVRLELLQSPLCPLASNCHIQGFVSGVHLRQPVLALSSKVSLS